MTISMKLFISFFVFTFSFNSVSFSASAFQNSYAEHCASVVPQSTEKENAGSQFVHLIHTGYYYTGGGSDLLNIYWPDAQVKNSIGFQCLEISETQVQGLLKIEGTLEFQVTNRNEAQSLPPIISTGSVSFRLNGFWSESSGKLCMVGSSSIYSKQGNPLVVLKLYNLINSTSIKSLISGTLENVMVPENDPKYLGPISILMLPRMNYAYTLVSTDSNKSCSSGSEDTPSSLQVERFCSLLSSLVINHEFPLRFLSQCITAKNCTPIYMSYLPQAMWFKDIACSEDNRRVRVLVEFSEGLNQYPTLFNPNTTLVGEGSWDAKKNELCVVACRFLDTTNSLNNTNVGDCSTRLSLRIPATGTIGRTSNIVGQIWSTKTVTELGYFEKIIFASRDCGCGKGLLPGQTYEYTKMEEVTQLCSRKKTANDKARFYPNPFLHATSFIMHAEDSEGQVGYVNCVPLSVNNSIYWTDWSSGEDACAPESNQGYSVAPLTYSYNYTNPINISYKIDLLQSNPNWGKQSVKYEMHINAEGIYDGTEGSLCMVGCRKLAFNSQQATTDSIDCEILVNLQFPATNAEEFHNIKGSIESTRKKSDPLHFVRLDLSTAPKNDEERRSIWTMDEKITLVLMSTTVACVSAALQFFHMKRNPQFIPSISILMLLILTLGYMLPLGINFEAMSMHNFTRRQPVHLVGGGWLDLNEMIIRVTTFVTFLIQFHLLKVTWSAKSENATRKVMEKKALFMALRVYAVGVLAALFLHRQNLRKRDNGNGFPHVENKVLDALIYYGSLVLDGFLFPQILLNMFYKSKENALSVLFNIGTTVARILPHAHALYRAHIPANDHDDYSYNYPAPMTDLYSTAWNVIIPVGGVLFAGTIYLQQRFGDCCCIAPTKLREFGIYEKVPTVHEE